MISEAWNFSNTYSLKYHLLYVSDRSVATGLFYVKDKYLGQNAQTSVWSLTVLKYQPQTR